MCIRDRNGVDYKLSEKGKFLFVTHKDENLIFEKFDLIDSQFKVSPIFHIDKVNYYINNSNFSDSLKIDSLKIDLLNKIIFETVD